MLKIPQAERNTQTAGQLVAELVDFAEQTPAAERTTDEFIDAMQLCDQLMAKVPVERARQFRARLREITVRVVRIHTVEEEMRYDLPYFAVEAGRPVQIVLVNEDLMPHNLVITTNGSLQEVAEEGAIVGPNPADGGNPTSESLRKFCSQPIWFSRDNKNGSRSKHLLNRENILTFVRSRGIGCECTV